MQHPPSDQSMISLGCDQCTTNKHSILAQKTLYKRIQFLPLNSASDYFLIVENMSFEQNEQQLWQRKPPPSCCAPPSPFQASPEASYEKQQQQPRRRRSGLTAIFFSMFSSNSQSLSRSRLEKQVDELKEEIRRQRDLKATYKAHLERTQNYLRYCLDVAEEHGFLHHICNSRQCSPSTQNSHPVDKEPSDPHLAAVIDQAKLNGWYIEPEEVELLEQIGAGTTADIFSGTWRGLSVAIKWIHPTLFQSNESTQALFAQELSILSRQRHPFVLHLMGACFQAPGRAWVVTELLSGNTLTEWLHGHKERLQTRSVPLPSLQERMDKGLEIAQAMQYLHQQKPKVIHRDLKPSNILLDQSMHVRVADFGNARVLADGEKALTGEMGTFVYMAPEVIRCEPYTEKCDVYSFGIILNELISGEHPYIERSFGPSKIALEVSEGRLRPKLPEDDGQSGEIRDLISCSWHQDAQCRPTFARISLDLRKIIDKLK